MISSIRIDKNVPMPMRDGVILRGDVYRPDDKEKYPAIVIRTPYDKALQMRSGDLLSAANAAFNGYVVVIQDARGRFASDGEWTAQMPEGPDGYDTVEWAAAAPWCDGNVGMAGGSYLASVQWQAAVLNPPHLKAICPAISQGSPLVTEVRMSGGMDLDLVVSWVSMMAVDIVNKMEARGKDVSSIRPMVERLLFHPEEVYQFLPLKDAPEFQIEGLAERFQGWLASDTILANLPSEDLLHWPYGRVEVPCFHVGCWYDIYAAGTINNYLGMRDKGGTSHARNSQHLLYGPWAHWGTLPPFVGGLHFGPTASGPASFMNEAHLAFFDKYLKGKDVPVSKVRYFVMGRDRWASAESWPPTQMKWQRFYLHSRGKANTANGDGLLGRDEPGAEPPDTFVYDPLNPVPTLGGRILPTGRLVPGPFDQAAIEKRPDVLCYSTPELSHDIEVTGPLVLHLFAATSAKDTDFMAKLVDVHPNGAAYNIAEGFIRARYRKSILHALPVTPGEICEYSIDMAATSNLFRRGHRIRIEVTSSNFPKVDRNMNTGNPFGQDRTGIVATQTIYHQAGNASYIDLPVVAASG